MLDNSVTPSPKSNNPFPPLSLALDFPVIERKIGWHSPHTEQWYPTEGHKMLLRVRSVRNGTTIPTKLAIVGDSYKIVRNNELFPYIEQSMMSTLVPDMFNDVRVNDIVSFGGRDCYREYIFPHLKCDVRGGDVAFRLIIGNSYGAKSITLMCGAIDFWCSNGMVFGVYEKTARKHTSGVTLNGIGGWLLNATSTFISHGRRLQKLEGMYINSTVMDGIKKLLTDEALLSARHVEQIVDATHKEAATRQGTAAFPSAWHLYSALTNWATHGDVRDTGNDHEANTRFERNRHVERVIHAVEKHLEHAA